MNRDALLEGLEPLVEGQVHHAFPSVDVGVFDPVPGHIEQQQVVIVLAGKLSKLGKIRVGSVSMRTGSA